jgi:putative ABC transport system permease protein
MNFRRFLLGSLRYHARSHLGVLLGAAVGSAALIGALVIGHSVRRSLEEKAGNRLGDIELALDAGDRLFTDDLVKSFRGIDARSGAGTESRFHWGQMARVGSAAGILRVRGTGAREDGTSRALDVHIHGVTPEFWALTARSTALREAASRDPWSTRLRDETLRDQQRWNRPAPGKVLINAALASRLRVGRGDTVILRFAKPSALSPDAVLSARNESGAALRLEVEDVLEGAEGGEFGLTAEARPALNAFVELAQLRKASGVEGRINLMVAGGGEIVRSGESWRGRFQQRCWGVGRDGCPNSCGVDSIHLPSIFPISGLPQA